MLRVVLIIIVIILLIWIYIAFETKNSEKRGKRVVVHDTYIVTKEGNSMMINGEHLPTLHLKKGVFYEFDNQTSIPFGFFGRGDKCLISQGSECFDGLKNGKIYLQATNDLPSQFFYGTRENSGVIYIE